MPPRNAEASIPCHAALHAKEQSVVTHRDHPHLLNAQTRFPRHRAQHKVQRRASVLHSALLPLSESRTNLRKKSER
jgi:hypothetical protein